MFCCSAAARWRVRVETASFLSAFVLAQPSPGAVFPSQYETVARPRYPSRALLCSVPAYTTAGSSSVN